MSDALLMVGRVAGAFGIKGEVRITSFTADPLNLAAPGQPTTLSWQVANATSIDLSPGIGSVPATGTRTLSPSTSTVYTLRATNSTGSVTKSVTVYVPFLAPAWIDRLIERFSAPAFFVVRRPHQSNAP